MSLAEVASKFSDEAAAWEYVESLRWNGKPQCPRCGSHAVTYLTPPSDDGVRITRTGQKSYRRLWKCRTCRRQFSVLIGTIFEGTKIPMSKWLMAIYLMSAGKNGVAALELQRLLGITYKSAWFMVHRIRTALANVGNGGKLVGTIIADEAWIGGAPKNRHASKRTGGKQGRTDKTTVFSLVNTETGEIRSQVVSDVTGSTIHKILSEQTVMFRSDLVTDSATQYRGFGFYFRSHSTVNHSKGEYVRNGKSTNSVEGHFAQLKRSIDGTHHGVSKEHLQRYAREFDFRYSNRKVSDGERATTIIARSQGVGLSYRSLIANGPVAKGTWPCPVGRPGPRSVAP